MTCCKIIKGLFLAAFVAAGVWAFYMIYVFAEMYCFMNGCSL